VAVILRVANFVVIGTLVLAAAYVYRIKLDSTVQAERLAKLRGEVRHERDEIAALRAGWGKFDNPERIEALANHYLQLKPIEPTQFDLLDHLPGRPPQSVTADSGDPIGGIIENLEQPSTIGTLGSIPAAAATARDGSSQTPALVLAPSGVPGPSSGAPR
jgi:hypothetical protein